MYNAALIDKFEDWARALFGGGGRSVAVPDLPVTAQVLLAWALARAQGVPVVLVADGPRAMETCARDAAELAPESGGAVYRYPPRETGRSERDVESLEDAGERTRALTALLNADRAAGDVSHPMIATCVQALMQTAPDPLALLSSTLRIVSGSVTDREALLTVLTDYGYESAPEVERKGQFAPRGGLLDVWSPQESWPYRLEFFDDRLESLRTFDPATQRSCQRLEQGEVFPTGLWEAARACRADGEKPLHGLPDYAPDGTVWIRLRADTHEAHAGLYAQTLAGTALADALFSWPAMQAALTSRPSWRRLDFCVDADADAGTVFDARCCGLPLAPGGTAAPDLREAFRQRMVGLAFDMLKNVGTAVFFFDTQGGLDHFEKEVAGRVAALTPETGAGRLHLRIGSLSEGFVSERLGLMLAAEPDLYGHGAGRRAPAPSRALRRSPVAGERLGAWTDIEPGDLVVHSEHGVGRYLGLYDIVFQGESQEVLTVEYAEDAKLHVPVSQVHLLSRYVGLSRRRAVLHRLGGKKWRTDKDAARQAIYDMAAQLLETQARRNAHKGHAFRSDHPWQREFEASFPYRETPDQARAIAEVKTDMESEQPMDRLLCGDAGYGKTEVAMRAAFKAGMEGRQTAVLTPTTVLAQQHFDVFRERMAPYPVRIEMLSRFCSKGQQVRTLAALAAGSADIVIGTHALLQAGVTFKDLGLVVIDEEQRFGVRHKEWFKHLRSQVDVLTLTATPIPRTLYMSLTGARDMSLIQTPPSERLAVETRVAQNTDAVVRSAILRELNREGQAFYLHNRVMTIERARERLERLAPEARMVVAHGQMPTAALEEAMRRFTNRDYDVLICTTIVESGLDMPSVNTILIDRADRFGIADLYQLRGRVGRGRHQGYAYLLLPPRGLADGDARQRIKALTEHARLGEGFKLAIRDLEIRGAGNVLGSQQSGHIAAIGFELYCQMLQRSVAELKNETLPPVVDAELVLDFVRWAPGARTDEVSAFMPHAYMEDERLRIQAYRRVAESVAEAELAALGEEWHDRFGAPPPEAVRLLEIARIRIRAAHAKVQRVETRGDRLILVRNGQCLKPGGRFPALTATDPDAKLDQIADRLLKFRCRPVE